MIDRLFYLGVATLRLSVGVGVAIIALSELLDTLLTL